MARIMVDLLPSNRRDLYSTASIHVLPLLKYAILVADLIYRSDDVELTLPHMGFRLDLVRSCASSATQSKTRYVYVDGKKSIKS